MTFSTHADPEPSGDVSGDPQAQRIHQLEQALDQALLYIDDLKQRVKQQADLDQQLATAQEYIYVQEQAIISLQQQLEAQRQQSESPTPEVGLLQEQILQQAKQTGEYEAAIHFWRNRCRLAQQQLVTMRQRLQEQMLHLPLDQVTAFEAILNDIDISQEDAPEAPSLDLPDFLVRRQQYRSRYPLQNFKFG
ncbi:MAG: hypothetical protein AAF289_14020 [Cyanobacteria bacterium P01_A01_bin.135]